MEYEINNGTIYAANKYPSGLDRKWSERNVDTTCSCCGSDNTDSDLTGDLVMLACLDCSNWTHAPVTHVVTTSKRGEVRINLPEYFDTSGTGEFVF